MTAILAPSTSGRSSAPLPPALQPPALLPPALCPYPVRRFSVAEYHFLIQQGFLKEDERVELLEGWIIAKMPHNPPHDIAIENTNYALLAILPAQWRIRIQSAITTSESEPEPDIVICTPVEQRQGRHPEPKDIPLIIEVADSSVSDDRGIMQRIYARALIPVYWIVNLNQRQVEVYTNPSGPGDDPEYHQRQDFREADSVPVVIQGQEVGRIAVSALLPKLPA
jgi:Uma2 family endonuclease